MLGLRERGQGEEWERRELKCACGTDEQRAFLCLPEALSALCSSVNALSGKLLSSADCH